MRQLNAHHYCPPWNDIRWLNNSRLKLENDLQLVMWRGNLFHCEGTLTLKCAWHFLVDTLCCWSLMPSLHVLLLTVKRPTWGAVMSSWPCRQQYANTISANRRLFSSGSTLRLNIFLEHNAWPWKFIMMT